MARPGVSAFIIAALVVAAAASAAIAPPGAAVRPVTGEQRVLVVLATWRPEPFARDEVQRVVFGETNAFLRASSYRRLWLAGTVTPWLRIPDYSTGCTFGQIGRAARSAAAAAGFDRSEYDQAIYVHPEIPCGWTAVAVDRDVWLNGALFRRVVAHELGHTFGLQHANTGFCGYDHCTALEYDDPYDTMGSGFGDFSAYAKFQLGWLPAVTEPQRRGVYELDPLEAPSRRPQALIVTTARNQYWLENRREPARDEDGGVVAPAGVLVRAGPNPSQWLEDEISSLRNMLVADAAGRGHPALLPGDVFGEPGVFELRVLRPRGPRARVEFRWTDDTRPPTPTIVDLTHAHVLRVQWREPRDSGSGLGRYEISLDGTRLLQVRYELGLRNATLARPGPGAHTVSVVAVDRAGNRSAPAVRRFTIASS